MSKVIGEVFRVTVNDDGSRVPQQDYSSLKKEISSVMNDKRYRLMGELHIKHQEDLNLLIAECKDEEQKLSLLLLEEYEEHVAWVKSLKPKMISYELNLKNHFQSTIFGSKEIFPTNAGQYIVDVNEIFDRLAIPKGTPYSFSWDWVAATTDS